MLILGIDPGTATTGYGFLETIPGDFIVKKWGLIETDKLTLKEKRLEFIYEETLGLLKTYKPDCFVIEKIYPMASNYNLTLVDGAHPGIIRDLQEKGINCMPINFGHQDENKQSLRSKMTTEATQAVREKRVRIHKIFTRLPAQLRAVQFDKKGGPDKTKLTFDLGDCFLMGINHLKHFTYKSIGVTLDGKIIDPDRERKSSLILNTEKFE